MWNALDARTLDAMIMLNMLRGGIASDHCLVGILHDRKPCWHIIDKYLPIEVMIEFNRLIEEGNHHLIWTHPQVKKLKTALRRWEKNYTDKPYSTI